MKDKKLMKQIVNDPKFSELIRSKLLTKNQIRLFDRIKALGEITTAHLHITERITAQTASGRLKLLFKKGYLKRTETIAESGGVEYVYKVAV